jgi:hypothetical protein
VIESSKKRTNIDYTSAKNNKTETQAVMNMQHYQQQQQQQATAGNDEYTTLSTTTATATAAATATATIPSVSEFRISAASTFNEVEPVYKSLREKLGRLQSCIYRYGKGS